MLYLYWSTDADAEMLMPRFPNGHYLCHKNDSQKLTKKNKYLSYLSSKNSSVRIGNIPVIDESLWRCKKI